VFHETYFKVSDVGDSSTFDFFSYVFTHLLVVTAVGASGSLHISNSGFSIAFYFMS